MGIALGPIPHNLKELIKRWLTTDRWADPATTPDAIPISGGPAYCTLLDAEGEMYWWFPNTDTVTRIEDGPEKVLELVIGAKYRSELSAWLPRRPTNAVKCSDCRGAGWHCPSDLSDICHRCAGLGWLPKLD